MKRVGFFIEQPTLKSFSRRFYPKTVYKHLRKAISLFIVYFMVLLTFSDCQLLGQEFSCSFDTIYLKNNGKDHHCNFFSATKISKCHLQPNIAKVSIQFCLSTRCSKEHEILCSVLNRGITPPNAEEWRLSPGVAIDEIKRTCTVTMFCPKALNQQPCNFLDPTSGYEMKTAYNEFDSEEQIPVLLWQQATGGQFQLQDQQPDQFYLLSRKNRGPEMSQKLNPLLRETNNRGKTFPKRTRDFACYGKIGGSQVIVHYESKKNQISFFGEKNTVIAFFQPQKSKLFTTKDKRKEMFILLENKLTADERINLIFLSMFSQWLVSQI